MTLIDFMPLVLFSIALFSLDSYNYIHSDFLIKALYSVKHMLSAVNTYTYNVILKDS